ncbi:MAG: BrnT family toxin [Acidobacteriaceae bacterium]
MDISYDPAKNERNIRERGLNFELAADFDFTTAEIDPVFRNDELRYLAKGFLGERLHVLCFKVVEDGIRVISFRKANKREVRRYEEGRRDLE